VDANGHLTYLVDASSDRVIFSFGENEDVKLDLGAADLRRILELGPEALVELHRERVDVSR
jgi:hypothetical protein